MDVQSSFSIHYSAQNCTSLIFHTLIQKLSHQAQRQIVIICIGSDRCIGDAVGPFIGSQLTWKHMQFLHVYGTLENPVHALNLKDTILTIQRQYTNPFIIALDASLGDANHIGHIQIIDGPLHPGTALFKKLPPIGDIHITATVNQLTHNRFEVLQNTRLYLITCFSRVISQAFIYLDRYLSYHQIKNTSDITPDKKSHVYKSARIE